MPRPRPVRIQRPHAPENRVARCDYFPKRLANRSYSRAKHPRVVLRVALALAVSHEIVPRNPMDHVSRLHRKRPSRSRLQSARCGRSGPRSRHGICPSCISRKGEPRHRQDHPKTDRSVRSVALPSFALQAIRSRLPRSGDTEPGALLFSTRVRTPCTTNNICRRLRDMMDDAGIGNVTTHRIRRTIASVVDDAQGALLASDLFGHTDPRITVQNYIQRNDIVNPIIAGHLERVFGRAG